MMFFWSCNFHTSWLRGKPLHLTTSLEAGSFQVIWSSRSDVGRSKRVRAELAQRWVIGLKVLMFEIVLWAFTCLNQAFYSTQFNFFLEGGWGHFGLMHRLMEGRSCFLFTNESIWRVVVFCLDIMNPKGKRDLERQKVTRWYRSVPFTSFTSMGGLGHCTEAHAGVAWPTCLKHRSWWPELT